MENHKGLNDFEKQLRQHPGRSCFTISLVEIYGYVRMVIFDICIRMM